MNLHQEGLPDNKGYVDHADDLAPTHDHYENLARKGTLNVFPLKLYNMLQRVEEDGFSDVVSWQPHGRCFVIHKPNEFKHVLAKYFALTKVSSFQRQINLYGFKRLWQLGPDRGGYFHPRFLRGKAFLMQKLDRVTIKGTGVRRRANPAAEPDFYSMKSVCPNQALSTKSDYEVSVQTKVEPMVTLEIEAHEHMQKTDRESLAASSPCSVWCADFEAEWAAIERYQEECVIDPLPIDAAVDTHLLLESLKLLVPLVQEIKQADDYPRPVALNGKHNTGDDSIWSIANFCMAAAA